MSAVVIVNSWKSFESQCPRKARRLLSNPMKSSVQDNISRGGDTCPNVEGWSSAI